MHVIFILYYVRPLKVRVLYSTVYSHDLFSESAPIVNLPTYLRCEPSSSTVLVDSARRIGYTSYTTGSQ